MSAETRTTSSTGGQKGVKIERYDLIPVGPLRALAVHFGKGARKYDDGQWRKGYEWSKTISALMRHLEAFREGLDYDVCSNDPDGCKFTDADGEPYEPVEEDTCFNHTGSHHLDAVMWHSFVLREFAETHPEHDDRHSTVLRRQQEAEDDQAAADGYHEHTLRALANLAKAPMWFIPEEPQFGTFEPLGQEWTDLGYTSQDGGLTADEPTRLTWSDETMVINLTDVNVETLRLLCGLPPVREPRFFVSVERGETEDLDPLEFINEAFRNRD